MSFINDQPVFLSGNILYLIQTPASQWSLYAPLALTYKISKFYPHTIKNIYTYKYISLSVLFIYQLTHQWVVLKKTILKCTLQFTLNSSDMFRCSYTTIRERINLCLLKLQLLKHIYTGCPRRNVPDFGRVFLMLKYTDITQNTYIQSWTVTEIMAREVWNFDSCYTLIDYQIHIKTGRNMWFL